MGDGGSELRVVLLGAPGSGKGTQAEVIAGRQGVPAISTGDMLRQAVAAGTELGTKVKEVMAAGALVEDNLMANVVQRRLSQADTKPGFLLDGYPRTRSQAATLDGILESVSKSLDHVVFIDVPEKVLVERALARQRDDDHEEVIRERLRVYRENTEPLIDLYRGRDLLREVDGDQTVDDVASSVASVIG